MKKPVNHTRHTRFGLFLMAFSISLLTACNTTDALEETPPPAATPAPSESVVPAPAITMSSIEVGLADGGRGLQFFARAQQDVFYRKVTIKPPPPFEESTYNLGNTFVIQEETIRLQGDNTAYRKVGGAWSFVYEVTMGTGAAARDHTIAVAYSVAGKKAADPGTGFDLAGPVAR